MKHSASIQRTGQSTEKTELVTTRPVCRGEKIINETPIKSYDADQRTTGDMWMT